MHVGGVELSAVDVADLIGRLETGGGRELAGRMGLAFDANRPAMLLNRADRAVIVDALSVPSNEPSFALREFRDMLRDELP